MIKFKKSISLKQEWPLLLMFFTITTISSVGGVAAGWYLNQLIWKFWYWFCFI